MAGYKAEKIVARKTTTKRKNEYEYPNRFISVRYPHEFSWFEGRLGTDERREDYI